MEDQGTEQIKVLQAAGTDVNVDINGEKWSCRMRPLNVDDYLTLGSAVAQLTQLYDTVVTTKDESLNVSDVIEALGGNLVTLLTSVTDLPGNAIPMSATPHLVEALIEVNFSSDVQSAMQRLRKLMPTKPASTANTSPVDSND